MFKSITYFNECVKSFLTRIYGIIKLYMHTLLFKMKIIYRNISCCYIPDVRFIDCSNANIVNFKFLEAQAYDKLEYLNISNNKNSNISECKLPLSLIKLNCSNCNIKDFKFIEKLKNLKEIIIYGNENSNIHMCNLSELLFINHDFIITITNDYESDSIINDTCYCFTCCSICNFIGNLIMYSIMIGIIIGIIWFVIFIATIIYNNPDYLSVLFIIFCIILCIVNACSETY